MLFSRTALLLSVLPLIIALDCTDSNALSWPPPSASSGDVSNDSCAVQYGLQGTNDPDALAACYAAVEQGQCASVGCGDGSDGSLIRKLKGRATLSCTSSETCYMYTDGSLLCLDTSTGDYTDDIGGSGNINTGEYTEPNGQVTTTLAGGETATEQIGTSTAELTGSSTATSIESSASRTGTATAASRTVASSTAASSTPTSATIASATAKSGVEKLRTGCVVGALGLVVGLVL